MTLHPIARVGSAAVAGVLLLVCAVGAQSSDEPLIRRGVASPRPTSRAVTPRDCASDYADTFRRVVRSIEIMDCDRCVR
jgi:hypothetical protein